MNREEHGRYNLETSHYPKHYSHLTKFLQAVALNEYVYNDCYHTEHR